ALPPLAPRLGRGSGGRHTASRQGVKAGTRWPSRRPCQSWSPDICRHLTGNNPERPSPRTKESRARQYHIACPSPPRLPPHWKAESRGSARDRKSSRDSKIKLSKRDRLFGMPERGSWLEGDREPKPSWLSRRGSGLRHVPEPSGRPWVMFPGILFPRSKT